MPLKAHVFAYLMISGTIKSTTAEGFSFEELDDAVMNKVFMELEGNDCIGFWASYPMDKVSYESAVVLFNNAVESYRNSVNSLPEVLEFV